MAKDASVRVYVTPRAYAAFGAFLGASGLSTARAMDGIIRVFTDHPETLGAPKQTPKGTIQLRFRIQAPLYKRFQCVLEAREISVSTAIKHALEVLSGLTCALQSTNDHKIT